MTKVNFKNVLSRISNQVIKKMRRIVFIAQKNRKKSLVQKGKNLTRSERQRNDVAHLLLHNIVLNLDEEK